MNDGHNPYNPIKTEVMDSIVETPMIKTLKLKPQEPIAFAAGQFVELTIPGVGEAPFTPSSRPSVKDMLYLTIMRVGAVTEAVHRLEKGDTVGLRGPLGTGYPIELFKDKEILVVGGGCGFAPLRSLMYTLFERSGEFKKLLFRGGCKSAKDLLYKHELEQWGEKPDLDIRLTVDVGDVSWKGHVGVVTDILDPIDMNCQNGIAPLNYQRWVFKIVISISPWKEICRARLANAVIVGLDSTMLVTMDRCCLTIRSSGSRMFGRNFRSL
jgi:NAD(P)H-flavin reductase